MGQCPKQEFLSGIEQKPTAECGPGAFPFIGNLDCGLTARISRREVLGVLVGLPAVSGCETSGKPVIRPKCSVDKRVGDDVLIEVDLLIEYGATGPTRSLFSLQEAQLEMRFARCGCAPRPL
jgi:hypothetical protein